MDSVLSRWFCWLLVDEADGVIQHAASYPVASAAIRHVADLWERTMRGESISREMWIAAKRASVDGATSAQGDAAYAAAMASDTALAVASYAVHRSVIGVARCAADSHVSAGRDVLAVRVKQVDKLLELLTTP